MIKVTLKKNEKNKAPYTAHSFAQNGWNVEKMHNMQQNLFGKCKFKIW